MKTITVLVADDHAVVRIGLKRVLESESDIRVIGEAQDGAEAIEKADALSPDVVLTDIYMPRSTGLDVITGIKEKHPDIKIIVLTVSQRDEDLLSAIRLGAQGYLLKSANIDEVVSAVRKCAAGETVLSPSLAGKLVNQFRQVAEKSPLSNREKEVLLLLSSGLSNSEISARLFISENTVRTYLRRLFEKLHLRNRVEAATYAREHFSPPRDIPG